MKKADRSHRNNEEVEPSFEDANYQDGMRVDPLTTRQEAVAELAEIRTNQENRAAEKAEAEASAKQKELEELKAELEERRNADVTAK